MKQEEFDRLIDQVMQKYRGTREPIPPKKEYSGTRKVQFLMVKYPPSQPTSPCESAEAGDDSG